MPKCLLNSVRGYRTGIYVGNPDYDPNVMTTRSGRSIRRVTLGLRNGNRMKCSPQQETRKAKQVVRKYPVVKYKSMSYMSFVTRFLISLRVPDLELAGVNPQETVEDLEDCQYDYRNDRVYSCSGDENAESAPSDELSDNYNWESDDAFPEEESNSERNDYDSVENDEDICNYDNVTEGESSDEECTDFNLEKYTTSETIECPVIPDQEESTITLDQYRKTLNEKIKETREIENSKSVLLNSPRIQSSSGLVTVKAAAAQFQNQIRPAVVVQLHPNDTCRPPLRCEDCKRDFTLLSAYTAHLKTHTKQRNKCNVCGKVFTRSWLLKGHMRTHTGERPFRCPNENCDKAFADKSNLRSHMMIHSVTSKNFTCQKCGRAFAQKRYLHKHLLEVCRVIS